MARPRRTTCKLEGCDKPTTFVYGRKGSRPYYCSVDHARMFTRNARLTKEYNITLQQYDVMLTAQDGRCAICRSDNPRASGRPRDDGTESLTHSFHVDHDHETGEVRGLLCSRCNIALGNFQDDVLILQRAVEYLSAT